MEGRETDSPPDGPRRERSPRSDAPDARPAGGPLFGSVVALGLVPFVMVPSRYSVLALVVAALIVSFLLFADRPRIGRHVVIAFVPWMVVASALAVFSTIVAYPAAIRPLVTPRWAHLSTYVVAATAWFAMLQFSPRRDVTAHLSSYLGSMGVGAAGVLLVFVFIHAGAIAVTRLAWLLITPVISVFAALAVLVLIGLWYIDTPAHVGVVGALVVFAHLVDALSTVIGVSLFDLGHTAFSRAVFELAGLVRTSTAVGIGTEVLWAGGFIWIKLILASAAVVLLTPVARSRPSLGYLLLGLLAALGITAGISDLLVIATGGPA